MTVVDRGYLMEKKRAVKLKSTDEYKKKGGYGSRIGSRAKMWKRT